MADRFNDLPAFCAAPAALGFAQLLHRRRFGSGVFRQAQIRQGIYDFDGFKADGNDLADEAQNVFLIVVTVGIIGDAGALVG